MHRPEQDRGETDWSQVNHSTALCNWYVISISVASLECRYVISISVANLERRYVISISVANLERRYVISISVANLERRIIACGFDVASIFDGERKWCKYNDGSSGKLDKGFRMKQTLLVDST